MMKPARREVRGVFSKRRTLLTTKYNKTMKELIEILVNENKSFAFPWWVYAFIMPTALVMMCLICGTMS